MDLGILLDAIKDKILNPDEELKEKLITNICHNSEKATPNSLFVCCRGSAADGHMYALSAYENGARVFVAEHEINLPDDAYVIIVKDSKEALSELAERFFSYPARCIKIIGVTGTKGKTTYAMSVYLICEMYGIKAGYIGTNGIYYNGKRFHSENTTPGALEIQTTLRDMADAGIELCIIEVSSQALWQNRIHGIEFDTCVFTNLYKDHIGGAEHPDFEHYKNSKKKLFTDYKAKHIIVNADSDASGFMCEGACTGDIITVSAEGNVGASLYATDAKMTKKNNIPGVEYICHIGNDKRFNEKIKSMKTFIPFPGLYSVENSLEVTATCLLLGIDFEYICNSSANIKIPGRYEYITLNSLPGSLFIIDYAHNGISLSSTIDALRMYKPSRIICLFGSVGGRTFHRRAELGKAAMEGADISIITSDNPNFEDPMSVIGDIEKEFINSGKEYYTVADRELAIIKAYEMARPGDYILLAGKGHEDYQLIGGVRVRFSEKDILYELDRVNSLSEEYDRDII